MQKIILITGASSGFGKVTASYLTEKGHIVYGTSRKNHTGEHFTLLEMDVTKKESIRNAVNTIIEKHHRIDILINNAGVGIAGAAELATGEEIALQINTNLIGTMNVCSEVLPYMRKQRNGKIINISSIGGLIGVPFQGIYSASKFGLEGYSESLSLELNAFNIKVVLVEPGDFKTDFTANRIISQITLKNNDYVNSFKKTLAYCEKEESNGPSPLLLAKKIDKIISLKNPQFRYSVGNWLQKLSIGIKKIVPGRWFQKFLRIYYKMN